MLEPFSMVTIRRATLDDKPELSKFIQQAYAGRWQYKIPDRWEWEFINNPSLKNIGLPVFIALEDTGKIVGQSCTMVEQVKIGAELHSLGWGVDAYVLPEYRNRGIGKQLQQANDEAQELFMSISMASVVRRIKLSLGAIELDPIPIYRRYFKLTPDIFRNVPGERTTQNQASITRWVSARLKVSFFNRFLLLMRTDQRDLKVGEYFLNSDQRLVLNEVDTFPEDVNLLWEKLSSKYYAIVQRDRLHLNWKYVEQPHMDYHRIIARRYGEVCGYLVLRKGKHPERNIGIISDIFVDPDDELLISTLFAYAIIYFRAQKVTEVISATTIPEYQSILDWLGFVKTGQEYPVIHAKVNNPAIKVALEPGKWFLGKSDHDWDQYPLAR